MLEKLQNSRNALGLIFMLPAAVLLLLFLTYPLARTPDLGVGKAEPNAQTERIGQEQQQQHRRWQHEDQAEGVAAVLELFKHGGLLATGFAAPPPS